MTANKFRLSRFEMCAARYSIVRPAYQATVSIALRDQANSAVPVRHSTTMTQLDDQQALVLAALLAMQRQSWEQGVASHAALDLGEFDIARRMAIDSVTRQAPDGRLAEVDGAGLVNSGSVAEVVQWAGENEALARQKAWLLDSCPRATDGTLFHIHGTREMWVDSVYMVVPALVVLGETDAAASQFRGHKLRLFDEAAGLWAWRYDEDSRRVTHPVHWGTGNGWVVAGLARAIRSLPDGELARDFAEHARLVIDAMLALRASSGSFHNVLDDESTFTDGTTGMMLAFAILEGVRGGWLPESYREHGSSIVDFSRSLVDENGFVREVCGAPHFDHQGTSAEAQSFFLLATAAQNRDVAG